MSKREWELRVFGAITDTTSEAAMKHARGLSQEETHKETNKLYNYTEASDDYYYSLGIGLQDKPVVGGAIKRTLDRNTH